MINPAQVCLYIPAELTEWKRSFFEKIGQRITESGGRVYRAKGPQDVAGLNALPEDVYPIIGAAPYLLPLVSRWRETERPWIGWDRGYVRRVFATWLPRGANGGYYRWHLNRYQMKTVRDVPSDRWQQLLPGNAVDAREIKLNPWRPGRGHYIVLAYGSETYRRSHAGAFDWDLETLRKLRRLTKRPIIKRGKECKRPLADDLKNAFCLVTHGSITAVESVILGCPVFVSEDSAAALVGCTDLNQLETPVYPDRTAWLHSLAYSQYNEEELVDGTLWRLIE